MNTANFTRKLKQAATESWWWRSHVAVTSTTVTATFRLLAGTVGPSAMTAAFTDLTVTAIDSGRRVLTVSGPPAGPSGPQGIRGEAWLEAPGGGNFSVRITSIVGTSVQLAEPLPTFVDLTAANGTLRSAWFSISVGVGDVTALVEPNIPTAVNYTERHGADITSASVDEVLIHVVRQPFRTGASHADVSNLMPSVGGVVARRAQDYRPQIELVGVLLEQRLHKDLASRSATEDDIDGSRFQVCHVSWAISCILEDIDTDRADRWMARTDEAYDLAMSGVWLDLDADGVVDDGEVLTLGDPEGDAGGTFGTAPDPDRIIGRIPLLLDRGH